MAMWHRKDPTSSRSCSGGSDEASRQGGSGDGSPAASTIAASRWKSMDDDEQGVTETKLFMVEEIPYVLGNMVVE